MKRYIALFESNRKGGYGVVFPDFPGCISAGNDYDDALRMAHEALGLHIDGMREDGDTIPEPRTLEQIKTEWEDWAEWEKEYDFVPAFVSYIPERSTQRRINVVLPSSLINEIDAVSRNRSAFLEDAARSMLRPRANYPRRAAA
jgi:predicted RNase H-like HicB family nuclease